MAKQAGGRRAPKDLTQYDLRGLHRRVEALEGLVEMVVDLAVVIAATRARARKRRAKPRKALAVDRSARR